MRLPARGWRHGRVNGRVTGGSVVAATHAAEVASRPDSSHVANTESRVVTVDVVVVDLLVRAILVLGWAVVAPPSLMTIIAVLAVVLHVVVEVMIMVLSTVKYPAVASVVRPVHTSTSLSERSIVFFV